MQLHQQRLPLTGDLRQAGEDVVTRQVDGVKADHYTMSIGLNALKRHGSPREAQCILALLYASGIDNLPRGAQEHSPRGRHSARRAPQAAGLVYGLRAL